MRSLVLRFAGSLTLGCSAAATPTEAPPPPACTTDQLLLHPAAAADYVELRVDGDGDRLVIARTPTDPCEDYATRNACLSWLAASRRAGFPAAADAGSYLAYTHGGDVGTVTNVDDLLAFLGPIDTPDEAMLLVTLTALGPADDLHFDCSSDVQSTTDGFDVFPWTVACERGDANAPVFHVGRDGSVTQTGEREASCPFPFPF